MCGRKEKKRTNYTFWHINLTRSLVMHQAAQWDVCYLLQPEQALCTQAAYAVHALTTAKRPAWLVLCKCEPLIAFAFWHAGKLCLGRCCEICPQAPTHCVQHAKMCSVLTGTGAGTHFIECMTVYYSVLQSYIWYAQSHLVKWLCIWQETVLKLSICRLSPWCRNNYCRHQQQVVTPCCKSMLSDWLSVRLTVCAVGSTVLIASDRCNQKGLLPCVVHDGPKACAWCVSLSQ